MPRTDASLRRRLAVLVTTTALIGATVAVVAPTAQADNSTTVTVVGTSDVFDSNLVTAVIKPGFEKAYPKYTLNYVSKGTGAAIAYAEAGSASALLVHAASLENQFVAAGYSAEPYGRALFWGDYVLIGPKSDPAGIAASDPHDIVGALEKVATAGQNGTANFVSRGGTPGTTVQEHAIWKLTTGVSTCTVTDANGGGSAPSTASGTCPTSDANPSWYHTTGLTQGPNVEATDTCNFSGGNCYTLTDRGTYDYLESTGALSNLKVVTRDNAPSAVGGQPLLVNSFHGYAINPSAFSSDVASGINKTGAVTFLNWITSPAGQTAIGNYLGSTDDPPFLPDAAPAVAVTPVPTTSAGGKAIKVSGSIRNVVPGTPALAGQPVSLYGTNGSSTVRIATTNTSSTGTFSFSFVPTIVRTYSVRTSAITQTENNGLTPIFADQLQPTSASAGRNKLTGSVSLSSATTAKPHYLVLRGTVAPAAPSKAAHLSLYATKSKKAAPTYRGAYSFKAGQRSFTAKFKLAKGTWRYYLLYRADNYLYAGKTSIRTKKVS